MTDGPVARQLRAPRAGVAARGAPRAGVAAGKGTAVAACLAALPVVALLAAGCSSASPSAGSPPPSGAASAPGTPAGAGTSASTGSPAAAAGGTGTAAGACASAALKAALGPPSGAAGSSYVPIRFTNVSAARCTLFGYPGVSFVTGPSGREVGNPADRIPLPAGPAHRVTLAPGGAANAVLQVADAGNYPASRCQPASAAYLRVFPPGQTAALQVKNAYGYQACTSRGVTTLHVEPVQPGAGSAGGG